MLTPIISIVGSFIGIYMKLRQQPPDTRVVVAFFVTLVFSSFLSSYYTHIEPLRDPAANGRLLLDTVGGRILRYGKDTGLTLRLNMMLIYRPAKYLFFKRYIRVRWSLNMNKSGDGTIEFDIRKGVAGEVIRTKRPRLVNMEESTETWGFTKEELEMFPVLTMIWSYPIFELNKNNDRTGKTLGALCIDSTTAGAVQTIAEDDTFKELTEELWEIAMRIASC